MPIIPSITPVPISQDAFGSLAFDVMHHVFAIHDEFGRFFDEFIYKQELARRMLFEFKTAEAIHPRHRAQAMRYLLLFGLHHGKVINMRPELVEHEFVNIRAKLAELRNPNIIEKAYLPASPGAEALHDILLPLIRDWGAALDLALYEEAITHFLGGESTVIKRVPVCGTGGQLGSQDMRLVTSEASFKLTAFPPNSPAHVRFQTHAERLLSHTPLHFIQWINIHRTEVTFNTIQRAT